MDTLDCEQLLLRISGDFNFHKDFDSIIVSILSECFRAAIALEMMNQMQNSIGHIAVPTVRITQSTRVRLTEIFKTSVVEQYDLISELNILHEISDIVKIEGGWCLAPQRLVQIDASNFLIVGGGPIQTLPKEIRGSISFAGRSRIISYNTETKNYIDSQPRQLFLDFIRSCHNDLTAWAAAWVKKSISEMVSVDLGEELAIYESNQWVNINKYKRDSSCALFRIPVSSSKNRIFLYGLGKVIAGFSGKSKMVVSMEIDRDTARRLQPLMCSSRPKVKFRIVDDLIFISLPFPMPAPESGFINYGWIDPYLSGNRWPKEYKFSVTLFPLIKKFFDHMGFELININEEVRYG